MGKRYTDKQRLDFLQTFTRHGGSWIIMDDGARLYEGDSMKDFDVPMFCRLRKAIDAAMTAEKRGGKG